MNFEKAKTTYRKHALVQGQMAKKLISALIKLKGKNFNTIFEIGAGTGFLTDEVVSSLNYKKLILNDLTENFTSHQKLDYIKGDILTVNTPNNVDLIMSNACFQWIDDYDLLFSKLKNSIKPGGILAFTYFGRENFRQIKNITGIGLNYPNLQMFFEKKGFKTLYFEEELETLYFKDLKEVLRHIKFTGVKTENKIWAKADFKNFEEKYLKNFRDSLGFELTYHPCYYVLTA